MTVEGVHVAVVGAGAGSEDLDRRAEEVGSGLARAGAVVVCGGLGGVMAAACRGARSEGGATIGILPGAERSEANQWVQVAIPTGMGEMRNVLVVRASDAVIAVGGEYGTLSEIAVALKLGRPVVGLGTWRLTRGDGAVDLGIRLVDDAGEAVAAALEAASARR